MTRIIMIRELLVTLWLCAFLGCNGGELVEGAIAADSTESLSSIAAIAYSILEPGLAGGAVNEEEMADQAAAAAKTLYTGANCLVSTKVDKSNSLSVITYTLDACNGPLGLKEASGKLGFIIFGSGTSATIQKESSIELRTNGIQISATSLDNLHVNVSTDNNARVGRIAGMFTTTGSSGQVLKAGPGGVDLSWDANNCLKISGQNAIEDINLVRYVATIANFRRCANQCPTSGTVTMQGADPGTSQAKNIRLTYDGQKTASVTVMTISASSGVHSATGSVALRCGD